MLLVTGSNGFVGSALCRTLSARGLAVRGAVRAGARAHQVAVGTLDGATDWGAALAGCDTVIHLAARVHVMDEREPDPLRLYRQTNVEASLALARQAHAAGVRRLVFVSSVKVNGEATCGTAFGPDDRPRPSDPYGISKHEAEQALLALGRACGLEVVIVRPPLVYGPGVKANFLGLIKLVERGLPLPFGSVDNRRSMVALDNLVDLLVTCATHPAAAGRIFMVSDGVDLSLAHLIRMIAAGFGTRAALLPVPPALMRGAARLTGRGAIADRLFGSLQVDIAQTQAALEWTPPVSPQAAINETIAHYLTEKVAKST